MTPEPKNKYARNAMPKKAARFVNHEDWLARHEDLLQKIPKDAHPPPNDHGEHSYTVQIALGRRNNICKIEVHVRTKGFRVVQPHLKRDEGPWIPWNDNIPEAWEKAKQKATEKIDQLA